MLYRLITLWQIGKDGGEIDSAVHSEIIARVTARHADARLRVRRASHFVTFRHIGAGKKNRPMLSRWSRKHGSPLRCKDQR
jgi:hypothetical protein